MNEVQSLPTVTLNVIEGKVVTTSRAVAERFGKRHSEVIRAIRNADCSEEFRSENIIQSKYVDEKGEQRPEYLLTSRGAFFILSLFTGKNSARMKEELSYFADQSIVKALNDFEIPDDMPDMYVYAIRNTVTGNVKIGISRNPSERLKQLQVGNDCILELVATKQAVNRFQDECGLHKQNSDLLIHGEWFAKLDAATALN